MSLKAAASGLVVFLLSVQVVQGQDGWGVTYSSTEICAVKGSTVEISCSFIYPSPWRGRVNRVEKTFWFTKQKDGERVDLTTDSEYAGRVEDLCENNICTLRIRNLGESDSAEYRFRIETKQAGGKYTGSPGVTLSLTDLSVQVESKYSNSANLKCQSSCVVPDNDYVWYKNGEKIQSATSSSLRVDLSFHDSYSCGLKGFEDSPSPSVCVTGRDSNTVTSIKGSICAPKGSSVDISCTYSSNECITSKFWFSPERSHQGQNPSQPEDLSEDSQYAGRVQILETERGRSTLRISDLRNSDSAQYLFKFKTPSFEWRSDLPGTTLTVTALQVQVITATVQQSDTFAELECRSSCSPAGVSYVWFKNAEKIMTTVISSHEGWFQHRDMISCALEGHEGFPSPAVYSPRHLSLSRLSGEIEEGSSVTLTCSSDANPAATYTWYKRNGNAYVPPVSEGTQLVFRSIQSSDSGRYFCSATNELGSSTSVNIHIDVKYSPKLPSVSVSPSAEIEEGSSVTLTCSSDANPAANYIWYKRNGRPILPPLSEGPQLVFSSIQSSDSGQYYCSAENKLGRKTSKDISIDVKYAPKTSSVSASPSADIEIGKSLQLTCKGGANPAATHTWYKDNQTLPGGSKDIYQLASITLEDKGNYHCESKNKYGQINSTSVHIDVQYAPKLPSVSVSPSAEIEEGSSVTLSCSSDANPAANYTWYKNNEDSPKASGQIFNITDFRAEHSGSYSCGAQNKIGRLNSTLHLSVVAGSMKSVAAGSITAVIVGIIFLVAFLLIRRKRSSKPTTDAGERPDNDAQVLMYDSPSAAVQSATPEQEAEVCYASVRFIQNQEDALYSNIKPAHLRRHKNDEKDKEDDVVYSTVTFKGHSATADIYILFLILNSLSIYILFLDLNSISTLTLNSLSIYILSFLSIYILFLSLNSLSIYILSFLSLNSLKIDELSSDESNSSSVWVYSPSYLSTRYLVQGQHGWGVTYTSRVICAVKGSSVEIKCSFTYPSTWKDNENRVEKTFWFVEKKDGEPVDLTTESEYAGRVENLGETNRCTLRIRNLRESDSAVYKFRIKTNQDVYASEPVTLSVTELQVKVTKDSNCYQGSCIYATLECLSSCPRAYRPSYIWYKNGLKSTEKRESFNTYFYPEESYACAFKGYENSPSPSVCVNGQACNTVAYSERSICAFKGSFVDISCMYSNEDYVQSKFWFRPERSHQDLSKDSQYSGRVQLFSPRRGSTLRISDLRDSDSAQYLFKFKTRNFEWRSDLPGTTLTVTERDLEVQVIGSSSGPKLVCLSSCLLTGHPTFIWYKNETEIQGETSASYGEYVDSANNYSCVYDGYHSRPVYGPKLPFVLMSPSGDIMEGSSVTLTCSSDANPEANYTWYKKDGNQKLHPLTTDPKLVFSSIQVSDSGQYYCTAENKLGRTSKSFFIDVKYPPKLPSVSVSPSAEIKEGSSVTLTCSSDANPAANYTWYKRNQTVFQGAEGRYNFTSISSEDRGIYCCKSENQYGEMMSSPLSVDVQYAPKLPSVSVSPSEIEEGSSVTLTCSSDANPAANYTWYKENEDSPKASGQIFNITDFRAEHSGSYYCEAHNKMGRQNSPLLILFWAGAWKSAATGTITAVLLAIVLIAVFLWFKRNKSDGGEKPDNNAQLNMGPVHDVPSDTAQPAEEQHDLHYSSIRFPQNQEDALYSNIGRVQPHRQTEEEEDMVEYTAVKTPGLRRQEDGEDSFALYSTVNK
ncbi:hypothetical protein NQZ68_013481 [Dissostichus eleginoides]|nr:hypothetical protein NQZ68_013481 [Dissostichus eleginoides]